KEFVPSGTCQRQIRCGVALGDARRDRLGGGQQQCRPCWRQSECWVLQPWVLPKMGVQLREYIQQSAQLAAQVAGWRLQRPPQQVRALVAQQECPPCRAARKTQEGGSQLVR